MRHFNSRFAGALLVLDARHVTGSVLLDTNVISKWEDLSGNNRHATQSVGTNQPAFRTNIQRGQPVVRFDGSNDSMIAPGIGAQPFTVFLLGRYNNLFNYFLDGVDGANRVAIGDGLDGVSTGRFSVYAGSDIMFTQFGTTGSITLWTIVLNGASSSMFRNFSLTKTGSVGTQGLPNGITIGNRYTLGGYNLGGDIGYLAFLPSSSISLQKRIQQSIMVSYKLIV